MNRLILQKYNEKIDPRQFSMSFQVAIALAGNNDMILTKSFIIITKEYALV